MSPSPREPEPLAEGTLISHLLELRDRLLRALLAVFIIFLPLVFFSNQLFTLIAHPGREVSKGQDVCPLLNLTG